MHFDPKEFPARFNLGEDGQLYFMQTVEIFNYHLPQIRPLLSHPESKINKCLVSALELCPHNLLSPISYELGVYKFLTSLSWV